MKNRLANFFLVASLTVSATLLGFPAQAEDLLQNGSFEDVTGSFVNNGEGGMSLLPGSTVIPGWSTINAELEWFGNNNIYETVTPYGNYFLDLTGNHDSSPYGGVTQTISTVLGQEYAFSLNLGTYQSDPDYAGPISVTASAGTASQTFTHNPSGIGNQWGSFSFSFIASSVSTPITIVGISTAGGQYIGLDNISVEPVPEPDSRGWFTALFALGIVSALKRKLKLLKST